MAPCLAIMSDMSTQKKKTTAKKKAPAKKAAPKKSTAKKAAPKKSPTKKAPAKKAPAKKASGSKSTSVVNLTSTTTTSGTPDFTVSFQAAPIHEAIDKTVESATVIINDFVDDIEEAVANLESALPESIKKTSFFKRIFRRKK